MKIISVVNGRSGINVYSTISEPGTEPTYFFMTILLYAPYASEWKRL